MKLLTSLLSHLLRLISVKAFCLWSSKGKRMPTNTVSTERKCHNKLKALSEQNVTSRYSETQFTTDGVLAKTKKYNVI